MFVMHFMGFSNGPEVSVIRIPQKVKSLVDKDIMHQKISKSIEGYAQSGPKHRVEVGESDHQAYDSRYGKYQEKQIVPLEKPFVFGNMMVTMELPKDTMHDVFMGEPGHEFHTRKGNKQDSDIDPNMYHNRLVYFAFLLTI